MEVAKTTPGISVTAPGWDGLQPAGAPSGQGAGAMRHASAAVGNAQRRDPTPLFWIQNVTARVERIVLTRSADVGNRCIHPLAVARHAPLHAAVCPALPNPGLPHNLTFFCGVERVDDARFLARQQ